MKCPKAVETTTAAPEKPGRGFSTKIKGSNKKAIARLKADAAEHIRTNLIRVRLPHHQYIIYSFQNVM